MRAPKMTNVPKQSSRNKGVLIILWKERQVENLNRGSE